MSSPSASALLLNFPNTSPIRCCHIRGGNTGLCTPQMFLMHALSAAAETLAAGLKVGPDARVYKEVRRESSIGPVVVAG